VTLLGPELSRDVFWWTTDDKRKN